VAFADKKVAVGQVSLRVLLLFPSQYNYTKTPSKVYDLNICQGL